MRAVCCLVGIVLVIIGGVSTAPAQPDFTPEALVTKLLPQADPAWTPDARFGRAVAVDGDTAVFGAPWEEHSAFTKVGAVYVFTLVGADWLFQQRIIAPDPDQYHEFGHSVAISGDTIVIGADRDDDDANDAGAAYVFVRSGELWSLEQKLTPDEIFLNEDDLFGHAVAIDGDTVAVAAPGNNNSHLTDVGAVFVYTRNAGVWTEQQKLIHADPIASDLLGISLAMDGDTLIAGASWKEVGGVPFAGAAYVFTRSAGTWSQQQKLTAPSGPAMEAFGSPVALQGDTAFVGVPVANLGAGREGAVDVFTRSGGAWTGHARLTASDAAEDDYFGSSLALDGGTVLIGAYGDDAGTGNETGSAYVFTGGGASWSQQAKLAASDGEGGDRFSWSVALEGDKAFIGAPLDDHDGGTMAGSGYVFKRDADSWIESQSLSAVGELVPSAAFGTTMAVDGQTLAVGRPWGAQGGAVFVYVNNGTSWVLEQILTPSGSGGAFGRSIDISGDSIVVGAPYEDDSGNLYAGAAYVFVRSGSTWTEQQRLTMATGYHDLAGFSVAIDGDTVALSAPYWDYDHAVPWRQRVGIVGVFTRSGSVWSHEGTIISPLLANETPGLYFGWSLALDGDILLVGEPGQDDVHPGGAVWVIERNGTSWDPVTFFTPSVIPEEAEFGSALAISGNTALVACGIAEVYVFERTGLVWTETQKLVPSDAVASFGSSIAIDGPIAAVGADMDNYAGWHLGSAYVFSWEGSSWTEREKLTAFDAQEYDVFGSSIAVGGDNIVVGAPGDDIAGVLDVGSAYVYQRSLEADLTIAKTNGQSTAQPGGQTTYIIVAANPAGPGDAFGASVSDFFPATLTCTWTCAPSGGATCSAGPIVGNINNDPVDLPLNGAATYTAVCDINPAASGSLINTATVTLPVAMTDPNLSNNTATDIDTLIAEADLAISKTNHKTEVVESLPTTYTIIAANAGPAGATGALVVDSFPPELTGCTWTCTPAGGATCAPSGSTLIADNPSLPVGGTATYTATCTVAAPSGTCANTATISPPAGTTDPVPGNDSASDTDHITALADFIFADGFESGGTTLWDNAVPTLELAFVDLDRPTGDLELVFELENAVLRTLSPLVGPLVGGADADCEPVFEVSIRRQAGDLELSARTRLDDGSWVSADWTTLPHHAADLRVAWRSALDGFADGHLDLTADDIPLIRLEHLANAGIALSRTGIGEDGSGRAALRLPR